jgi:hypothetical protein
MTGSDADRCAPETDLDARLLERLGQELAGEGLVARKEPVLAYQEDYPFAPERTERLAHLAGDGTAAGGPPSPCVDRVADLQVIGVAG